jgi:hypothetical protein
MKIITACVLGLLTTTLGSCRVPQDNSKVELVNGKHADTSELPAAVRIGTETRRVPNPASPNSFLVNYSYCTAGFISDRVLVTAEHCVRQDTEIFVADGVGKGAKSRDIRRFSAAPGSKPVWNHDLAAVIFPAGTAAGASFELGDRAPTFGERVTIVGYGFTDAAAQTGGGYRQVGTATIAKMDPNRPPGPQGGITMASPNLLVIAASPQSTNEAGNGVLNSQGDSGGPMLFENKLVGVSSTNSGKPNSDYYNQWVGNYFDVTLPAARQWLESLIAETGGKSASTNETGFTKNREPSGADGIETAIPTTTTTSTIESQTPITRPLVLRGSDGQLLVVVYTTAAAARIDISTINGWFTLPNVYRPLPGDEQWTIRGSLASDRYLTLTTLGVRLYMPNGAVIEQTVPIYHK